MMRLTLAAALMLSTSIANAQETSLCMTSEECRAQAEVSSSNERGDATSALAAAQTQFYWMNRVNMASFVMLVEEGIIPPELSDRIADGIQFAIDQGEEPDGRRPSDVIQLENIIVERAGAEATLIHSGRSRQDMYAAIRTMQLRQQLLDVIARLNQMRGTILEIAAEHTETFIPAYTNGVQAQPITYAHYLSAFADSYARDADRLLQAYDRVNMSAMGTAVLANSSWPLNRERLADLLGFDRVIENSYDSGQVSPMDVQFEVASNLANISLRIGSMLQDIHVQYHQIEPWILLGAGSTYTSSAMPQKANPGVIMNARQSASDVAAALQTVLLRIHNVTPGMTDYKATYAAADIMAKTVEMLERYEGVMEALTVNPERGLAELEAEWTTSMNTAETMQRLHGIPFRVGHSFASEIVSTARAERLTPMFFNDTATTEIYTEIAARYDVEDSELPLTEEEFRESLSPSDMVRGLAGIGSPNPSEAARMIDRAKSELAAHEARFQEIEGALFEAEARLNEAFAEYLPN